MKKTIIGLLLIAALALNLVACNAAPATTESQAESTDSSQEGASTESSEFISFGATPIGQTAYVWGAAISDLINNSDLGYNTTVEETSGMLEIAGLIEQGELEFGFVNNLMATEVYDAINTYSEFEPGQLKSIMTISPTEMQIFKLKDSDVEDVYDLAGKRVGLGQPGGISLEVTMVMMEQLGYEEGDYEPFKVNLAEQCNMLRDGQLDVGIWIGSAPMSALTELAASKDIEFLPIPDELVEKMAAVSPAYTPEIVKAETYNGQTEDLHTFSLRNTFCVNTNMPDETVYNVTKLVMENLDSLEVAHSGFGMISTDSILTGIVSPIHPGAYKYYEEIGVPGIENHVTE